MNNMVRKRVRLKARVKNSDIPVGMTGIITEILKDSKYPIKIRWGNGTITSYTSLSKANFEIIGDDVSKRKRKRQKKKKDKKLKKQKQKGKQVTPAPLGNQGQIFGVQNVRKTTPVNDSWEVDLDIVEECSKGCTNGAVIWIKPLAKVKIDALMDEYPRREWLAYLLGDKESNTVLDIFIPEQVATAARVDDIECTEFNDLPVIGVIHSHHNMGTSFSHTDHTYINQNHDISLVVSHDGIDGQIRHKVPCGALKISDITVRMSFDIEFDKEKFIEKAKENISYTRITNFNQGWSPGDAGWAQEGKVPPGTQKSPYGFYFNGKWCSTVPEFTECGVKDCTIQFKAPKYKIEEGTAGKCPTCSSKTDELDDVIDATIKEFKDAEKKSLAQLNQQKIEEAWDSGSEQKSDVPDEWTTGKKNQMGNYLCGRCKGNWQNVNLNIFQCPNCDADPDEKSLEQELQMIDDSMSEGSDNKPTCRICKMPTKNINSVHQACLQKEKEDIGQAMTKGGGVCEVCGKAVLTDNTIHYKCLKKQEHDQTQPII